MKHQDPTPCRLLVVDHDGGWRCTAERELSARGFVVRCAAGALEAMFTVEATRPAVVLCELDLPGVEGMVLAEALKRTHSSGEPAVVGLTADVRLKQRAARVGRFDALVDKPVDWDALSGLLGALCIPHASSEVGGRPASATGATVLVIDDDRDVREALGDTLEEGGLRCLTAEDGQEALDVLRAGQVAVDAMLLDLMMPRMDGWQLLRRMQSDEALRRIPVIVMSAGGPRALATLPPSQPRVAKPVDIDELLDALARVLPQLPTRSA